jgi:hypothetical protein
MDSVAREELLSKPEIQAAAAALREQLAAVVPPGQAGLRSGSAAVTVAGYFKQH